MALPPIQALSADVSVAPQLDPQAMAQLAEAGFKSVVNNRPDFEGGPSQPTNASIEAAAHAAGLAYVFLQSLPASRTRMMSLALRSCWPRYPSPCWRFAAPARARAGFIVRR